VATTANRQDFINRTRLLASAFIKASDTFYSLAGELKYSPMTLPIEEGGLSAADFVLQNSDLTAEQLLGFFATMQALLEPLTDEQRRLIYAVKGSSTAIPPPPGY
jgi:hypothetical protein